ncbi:MAG: histidine phosphatase family protein [Planctomycetes bacterium]|nr:histidine phosphatase family protein [Planctomycetota bacterium]
MRILLIRHGDPDYSIDNLTPRGQQEASALAAHLSGVGIDKIFASSMGRAKATAEYTAKLIGVPVMVQDWARELDLRIKSIGHMAWDVHGHLLGDDRADVESLKEIMTQDEYDDLHKELARIQVESDRFLAGLGYVREGGVYRVEKRNEDKVALFCHGGFGLTWLSVLLHVPVTAMWAGFFLHTTSVTEILFDEREEGTATPRCIGMGSMTHLVKAGLEPSQAGIKSNYY